MKVVSLDKSEDNKLYVPTSTIVKEFMKNIVFLVLLLILLDL